MTPLDELACEIFAELDELGRGERLELLPLPDARPVGVTTIVVSGAYRMPASAEDLDALERRFVARAIARFAARAMRDRGAVDGLAFGAISIVELDEPTAIGVMFEFVPPDPIAWGRERCAHCWGLGVVDHDRLFDVRCLRVVAG